MSDDNIVQIKSAPGIKRDGTRLEGDAYVDGQWVRFQRGLPRKMGGYRAINKYLSDISRTLIEYTQDRLTYVHAGSATAIERFYIDGSNNTSVIVDRTPAALTASENNMWQFDIDTKLSGGIPTALIVAQVAPNLACICNSEGGELYYGELLGTAPLEPITLPTGASATGGVVALHPYTFFFGNNGYIGWSIPGDPTDLSGAGSGFANVTSQKIVRGMPLRGGGGPSGLFWSADALIRATFVGGTSVFSFDTISTQSSILGPATVIEYDGVFYWIGVDRFLMFNGVVREVENNMNINFFFDNLNGQYRQKVFAMKVPRYGEIWWCFPKGHSTEPDHAVVYNVRENTWYDTPLPNGGRSAGLFPTVFSRPLMTGAVGEANDTDYRVTEEGDYRVTEDGTSRTTEESGNVRYKLWVHEIGTDEIDGQSVQPVLSFFETADISLPVQSQKDKHMQVLVLEPDFVQQGDMTVQVRGRANARSPEIEGDVKTFPDVASTADEQVVFLNEGRRQMRFRFASNALGGDYQMGLILAHLREADGTVLG